MRCARRAHGERGVAMVMTSLVLLPLMIFAAFGVDLASWYSRISYLQKSADAAALAGTVWMPDLTKATAEAKASLRANGIVDKDEGGTDDIDVEVARGARATSLRVMVTDNSATRYFSAVFSGDQSLTRSAEAEYNLPIPLGSPLNYFGGDASKTARPPVTTWSVSWPSDYQTRPPANAPCNVGTSSSQNLGGWSGGGTYRTTHSGGDPVCQWRPTMQTVSTAPTNFDRLAPINVPCNVQQSPPALGRWSVGGGGNPVYSGTTRHTAGTGNRQCQWSVVDPSTLPPTPTTSNPPDNRPCNIPPQGRWPASGGFQANQFYNSGANNRVCTWQADLASTTVTPPNPIDATRSPGFWAMIEGPGTVATQGDAYTPRCYLTVNCGSPENASYRADSNPNRGYWYVVKIPAGLTGSVDIRVFDASNNPTGSQTTLAGDFSINASNQAFETEYRLFEQTNPLDFTSRSPVASGGNFTAPGNCHWRLGAQTEFRGTWQRLCTLAGVAPGDIFLLNVRTNGTTGSGVNGYALEACANGSCSVGAQPALYAFADMAMYNNAAGGTGTFYLAEVGPQYAGKTLVIELWDAGDASSGNATIYPMMPSPVVAKPVEHVPASRCQYTSSPSPNAPQSSSPGGPTGVQHANPRASDEVVNCAMRSTIGGARQFNGEWLRIRVTIPSSYTWCTPGVNPETTPGSCWWGIRYNFTGSPTDVTTWQARIEGNPVHLTQ